ncbi:MAG: DoxX family protein [Acidimicrobiia bacterium]|nr:DoxX family protein [Acidimicrobiia bacterium]MYC58220.1 DoxX family protein [Acidimicrobiia bacterium]MYI30309.1 DoxX family protein [Acidimicrobiia bacterium]
MANTTHSDSSGTKTRSNRGPRIAKPRLRFGKGSPEDGYLGQFFGAHFAELYLIFRVGFAIMTLMHGLQKTFLLWGFPADQDLDPAVDIAGIVELIAAFLIGFGILTRIAAGAMMVVAALAFFLIHLERGLWPHYWDAHHGFDTLHHGGEVVILHFLCAWVIGILGSGKWGLERRLTGKELL